jgi:hypothetical protein
MFKQCNLCKQDFSNLCPFPHLTCPSCIFKARGVSSAGGPWGKLISRALEREMSEVCERCPMHVKCLTISL